MPRHKVKALLDACLEKFKLSDRQAGAIKHLIGQGTLANAIYQKLNNVSKPTATRDLQDLVKQGVIANEGRGAGAVYRLTAIQTKADEDEDKEEE